MTTSSSPKLSKDGNISMGQEPLLFKGASVRSLWESIITSEVPFFLLGNDFSQSFKENRPVTTYARVLKDSYFSFRKTSLISSNQVLSSILVLTSVLQFPGYFPPTYLPLGTMRSTKEGIKSVLSTCLARVEHRVRYTGHVQGWMNAHLEAGISYRNL